MDDDRILQYENATEGNILSPDSMQDLNMEDEQLLFDQLHPNSMSNTCAQGEDPFTGP